MRELEVNEILFVSGGDYSWWSIPIFAGAASGISNAYVSMFVRREPVAAGLAVAFLFGAPAALASLILLAGFQLTYTFASMLPLPAFAGAKSASCHG